MNNVSWYKQLTVTTGNRDRQQITQLNVGAIIMALAGYSSGSS